MSKSPAVATDCMLHNQNRTSEHTIRQPLIQLTIRLLPTITNMYTVRRFVSHCLKNASTECQWKLQETGKYTLVK